MSKHIGSKFANFLDEEGLLAEVEAVAAKRVIAFQLRELMKKQKLTKLQLAKRGALGAYEGEQGGDVVVVGGA